MEYSKTSASILKLGGLDIRTVGNALPNQPLSGGWVSTGEHLNHSPTRINTVRLIAKRHLLAADRRPKTGLSSRGGRTPSEDRDRRSL